MEREIYLRCWSQPYLVIADFGERFNNRVDELEFGTTRDLDNIRRLVSVCVGPLNNGDPNRVVLRCGFIRDNIDAKRGSQADAQNGDGSSGHEIPQWLIRVDASIPRTLTIIRSPRRSSIVETPNSATRMRECR